MLSSAQIEIVVQGVDLLRQQDQACFAFQSGIEFFVQFVIPCVELVKQAEERLCALLVLGVQKWTKAAVAPTASNRNSRESFDFKSSICLLRKNSPMPKSTTTRLTKIHGKLLRLPS